MRQFLVFLFIICASAAPAKDRPPQGIGFAQAGESAWLCRKAEPEDALNCAREQCAEQAPGQKCWATAWCFPAGWSGLLKVELPDLKFTRALCGAPSETALKQALRALCTGEEGAEQCQLFNVIDPDGNERGATGETYPGPAAKPAETPAPAAPAKPEPAPLPAEEP